MGKVSESIFSGNSHVIPLAEVLYIQRQKSNTTVNPIWVIMKGTTANNENGDWNNAPFLRDDEAASFLRTWCDYRSELESETLMDLAPSK